MNERSMTQIVLTLLGAFAVTVAAGEQPRHDLCSDKARIVGLLGASTAQAHRRELLAALFWPEISQQAALTNLRQTFLPLARRTGPS